MGSDPPSLPAPLVQIKDVFGFSEPGKRLVEAIAHGVGRWAYPWQRSREAKADIAVFREWAKAIKEEGTAIGDVTLSIEDRPAIRVTAQEVRRQENREAIASAAISEFRENPNQFKATGEPLELEWLDKFWRLAEDVSHSDFQSIWGRILARHAAHGTPYSARCLLTLSTLSKSEAAILERLASVAVRTTLNDSVQPPCILNRIGEHLYGPGTKPSDTALIKWLSEELAEAVGPIHGDVLGPIGIYVESGWAHSAALSVSAGEAHLSIGSAPFRISGFSQPLAQSALSSQDGVHLGSGMRFSPVGSEIVGLIRTNPNPDFVRIVDDIMQLYGLKLEAL